MKKAIYAGSFDPLQAGHLSVIDKALKIVKNLLVVVANNPEKNNSDINKRYQFIKQKLKNKSQVKVIKMTSGLIANLAKKENIKILIRSARDKKDFEFELMMAIQNKKINKNIETILILPDKANIKIRSSILPKKNH